MASPCHSLEGKNIQDVVDDLYREHIDVEVEVRFQRREHDETQSWDSKRSRVVGIRDEDDDYHLYITNLPRKEFLPTDVATLYRCRWVIELLFRELKTQYDLDEFGTSKEHIVEILVYAALLSLLVSRELLDLVTEQVDDEIVFSPERWAATFRSHAQVILRTVWVSIWDTRHHRCLTESSLMNRRFIESAKSYRNNLLPPSNQLEEAKLKTNAICFASFVRTVIKFGRFVHHGQ